MATKTATEIGLNFVDHVAIAVPAGDLDKHIALYEMMGFTLVHKEEVYGKDQVREALLRVGDSNNLIQLLEPLTPDSPVAKQTEKNGNRPCLAHVAFRTKDIQATFRAMKSEGFNLLDEAPRPGSRKTTVFFVHPKTHPDASLGVLYEIVEAPEEE